MRAAIVAAAMQLGDGVEHGDVLPANIIDFLVARQPALVVLDVTLAGWKNFALAAKTNPATRRLPILAVAPAHDAALMLAAKNAGCDAVLDEDAFVADAAGSINKHARTDDSEELLRQSQLPLSEMAQHAIEQFNRREFFEQHETFEHLWRQEPGPVRQMYQGILQVGVAYLQIQRCNYAGARKIFQRAWQYLSALPDVCQGVDIAQFKADARAAQDEMERLGPARIAEFPDALFKPVRYSRPAPIDETSDGE